MDTVEAPASLPQAAALAVLRMAFGAILFTHGLPKLLHEGHGSMGAPLASSIHLIRDVLGLPLAPLLAWAVTLLETLGAALLAAGLLTRLVAGAFCVEMVGICFAFGPAWPWIDRGIEYPVLMGVLAGFFAVGGGGPLSVEGWWGKTRPARG